MAEHCPECHLHAVVEREGRSLCLNCASPYPIKLDLDRSISAEQQARNAAARQERAIRLEQRSVVYFVSFADRVKIGTTRNLHRRLTVIYHDEILAVEPGGPRREQQRHTEFIADRVPGQREWFYRTPRLDDLVKRIRNTHPRLNGQPPSLVTVTQAGILLGRPKSTIHAWIEDERMTATDERPRRVRLDELYELDDRMARAEQTRRRSFNTVARPER